MKSLIFWTALAVAGVAPAFTVKTVATGETLEIFGTKSDDPENNTGDVILDLQAGSTLKLSKKSQTGFNLWASLICTNGAAVVEISDGIDQLDSKYNFIVRAPGSLTIKRPSSCAGMFWGYELNGGSPDAHMAQYDFSGLTDVVDAEGNRSLPQYFAFGRNATLWGLPPAHLPIAVNPKTIIALAGENMFTGDVIELSPTSGFQANITVLNTNAIAKTQTVKLAEHRTIRLRPCTVPDFATTQNLTWTLQSGAVYDFGVEGVTNNNVYSSCNQDVAFVGKVKGQVELYAELSVSSWAKMTYSCLGDLSEWTGQARVGTGEKLLLNASRVYDAFLWDGAELRFTDSQTAVAIDHIEGRCASSEAGGQKVSAAAGQTISIRDVNGTLVLAGDAEVTNDAIDIASSTAGAHVTDEGTAKVTFNGAPSPANALTLPPSDDTATYWFLPSSEGLVSAPGDWLKPPASNNWYVVKGNVTIDTLPLGTGVRRAEGETGTTTLQADLEMPSVVGVHAGESVVVKTQVYNWRQKAILWLDPSQDDLYSWVRAKDDDTSAIQTGSWNGETCRAFRGLIDPRRAETGLGLRAWQSRSWMFYTTKGYESLATVHPLRATKDAPAEGLAYMAFGNAGSSRRIQFENWVDGMTGETSFTAGYSPVKAKFVVMVFGSQGGGGSAMFGSNSYFQRAGKTLESPMLKKTIDVWTNGVKVADSKTAPFSGSWDVISVNTSGAEGGISLLGGNATSDTGGHYLGEMLFFDEVLSDADRRDVERYLAQKWGLANKYTADRNVGQATLAGSGDVAVADGSVARLSGAFSGTLTLGEGVNVTLAEGALPYTEAEVAALEPSLWIDPSLGREVITYATGEADWARVNYIVQKDPAKRALNGENHYLTAHDGARKPTTVEKSCFFGPSYTWVDYNGTNETATSQGNTLRVTKSKTFTGSSTTLPTEMGFIVQDSRRGGGTPFLDNVLGSGLIKTRKASQYTSAMYESGTTDLLKKSPVYLNGAAADYTKGFTGAPEVFTFTATEQIPVGYFALLSNSENGARRGEEQSEILLFGSKLEDGPRSRVEAYLMKKWFGFVPTGFTDYSSATLDGAGTFTAANAAVAPKLAPTFTGTYAVGGDTATYNITVQTNGTVVGALVAPNATLSLPATVTLNVSVDPADASLPIGDYVLVQAADMGATEFVLEGALKGNTSVEFVKTGTSVSLAVRAKGTVLLFR